MSNNPCERCGHPMTSHDSEGSCSHAVNYGDSGQCVCGKHGHAGYLRAVVSVPELLAAVLHTGPGRDAHGNFYNHTQARLVGIFAEALLDTVAPTNTGNALDLCEAWKDHVPSSNERRAYCIQDRGGDFEVVLTVWGVSDTKTFSFVSVTSSRDAAAKAIMLAGAEGFR
jgi:hypothetical protein